MKVAVTGANSFLGSWICRELCASHEVLGIVRPNSNIHRLSDLENIRLFRSESKFLKDIFLKERPQILILNDWWGVGNKLRNHPKQYENVSRVVEIVQFALAAGVEVVVGVGSQAELGPQSQTILESTLGRPTTTYGNAKALLKQALEEMITPTETRFVWARIFSTYGPLDDGKWLIPTLIDSLLNSQEYEMTFGEQEWSYLHAFDLSKAFGIVVNNRDINGLVHIGNPSTITIRDLAEMIGDKTEKKHLIKFGAVQYRVDQVMLLKPLCETLSDFGWQPLIDLSDGVDQTIRWLKGSTNTNLTLNDGSILNSNLPSRTLPC